MAEEFCTADWMAQEESVVEKVDESGHKWRKVYFGGGAHFENWLEQFKEIYGEQNIEVEEADASGLACFEKSGEKFVRVWARING